MGEISGFLTKKINGFNKLIVIFLIILLLLFALLPIINSTNENKPLIKIINFQSYPVIGGNWTVKFNTIGKADLIIKAINGTLWSNNTENDDLKFIELKCVNKTLDYEWINNSVFINNFSSNSICYEKSIVLTPGPHTLMFKFGEDVAFARNLALEYWIQTTDNDFINGTRNNINISNDSFKLNDSFYIRNTTLINQESFENQWPPNSWTETNEWNKESDEARNGIFSADFDGNSFFGGGYSGNLITPALNCSNNNVTAIYVDFWTLEDSADNDDYYLDYYNGNSWNQITRLDTLGGGSWYHYTEKIVDTQYFVSNFQIRWRVVTLGGWFSDEHVYVDYVNVTLEENESGYVTSGNLISEPHDTGRLAPIYNNIKVDNSTANGTSIITWIKSANSQLNLTNATWFSDIDQIPQERWVQWRINLTGDEYNTSIVNEVNLTWYYDNDKPNSTVDSLFTYWQKDTPFKINVTATDNNGSGIKEVALYYNYSANNATGWTGWTLYDINDTISPYNWSFNPPNGDGYYRFYSIAIDKEINIELPPTSPDYDTYNGADTVNPSSEINNISPYWLNETSNPLTILTSSAMDNLSGLKEVTLYYRYRIDNGSIWSSWLTYNTATAAPWSWSFNFPKGKGHYQFYSISVDNAENYENPPVTPDNDTECGYNTSKPSSEVNDITPYWSNTSPVNINGQATDFSSTGLNNVTLYYHNSTDNISWSGPWKFDVDIDPWNNISWSFNFPNGTKYYRFFSIATDNNSNIESYTNNDTECGYDTAPPSSQVDILNQYWYDIVDNPISIHVSTYSDDMSGVKNITLYYRYRTNNGTGWNSWTSFGKDENSPFLWNFNFPSGDGHYELYSIANDAAYNQEVEPPSYDTHCGYNTTIPSSKVNNISPYTIDYSPITITAIASEDTKNLTLWYRWSENNNTVGGGTIKVDNISSTQTTENEGSSVSWSHSIGNSYGNRILVVCSSVEDSTTTDPVIASANYNNKALTKVDSELVTSFYTTSSEIWYILNPDTGTNNIQINYTGIVRYASVGAISLYNVSQNAPGTTNTNNVSSSQYISTNITTLSNGSIVIDSIACGDSRTFTPNTGQTEFFDESTGSSGGAGSYKILSIPESTIMGQTASSSSNRMAHVVVSFSPVQNIDWKKWNDVSNPDINSPWSWNFNFPNGTGYYEFYSIAIDHSGQVENPPSQKDAMCYYTLYVSSNPIINNYDLRNLTGSKLNNISGLIDVNKEYYFTINITDVNGIEDIDYVNITTWYDNGNETNIYNQTSGGNLNMFLQYENSTMTGNIAIWRILWPDDEVQLISGNCTETNVDNNTRVINISFKPLSQTRWANSNTTWNTAQNMTNDPWSWNFNITVIDRGNKKSWKTDEYGIYKYTSIVPESDWVDVIAAPGFNDTSSIVSINYTSNYNFNMTIFFEQNLSNKTRGDTIPIANNVEILANTDPNDDIISDITFLGIGETNSIDIFNQSGVFQKNNTSQTVNVQFNVYIPLGTLGGKYTSRIAAKIIQE